MDISMYVCILCMYMYMYIDMIGIILQSAHSFSCQSWIVWTTSGPYCWSKNFRSVLFISFRMFSFLIRPTTPRGRTRMDGQIECSIKPPYLCLPPLYNLTSSCVYLFIVNFAHYFQALSTLTAPSPALRSCRGAGIHHKGYSGDTQELSSVVRQGY